MIPDLRNTKESPGHSPVICRKMAGIVCFLLKIHPRRQCIRCLLLLFLGGDNRRAVALLGTVAAESGMTAAVNDRFGSVLRKIYAVGFVLFAVQYAVLAAVGGIDPQAAVGQVGGRVGRQQHQAVQFIGVLGRIACRHGPAQRVPADVPVCDLRKADFRDATGYKVDILGSRLKDAKFSLPEAVNLLADLKIKLS